MTLIWRRGVVMLFLLIALAAGIAVPPAHADNKDCDASVFAN